MPTINHRLKILQQYAPKALRAQALTSALRRADDDEINPIAESLLDIPSVNGCEALLNQYYRINTKIKQKFLQIIPKYSLALTRTAHSPSPELRLIALQLIDKQGNTNFITTIENQFSIQSNTPEIIGLAARILLKLTRRLSRPGPKTTTAPILMQQLDHAVATAINHYPTHRRPEIILAAALLAPNPGHELANFFKDQDHPAHFALRGVIKKFDDNLIADSALQWLTLNHLAPQLIDRIAKLARTDKLTSILKSIHLTIHPVVNARLQRLDSRFPCTIRPETSQPPLTPEQQLQLVRWLNTIPMKKITRIAHLSDALAFTNPAARLAALRALINRHSPEANAAVESFTFDENEQIARLALRRIIRTSTNISPVSNEQLPSSTITLLTNLLNSPHSSIRQLAQSHLTTNHHIINKPFSLNTLFNTYAALSQTDHIRNEQLKNITPPRVLPRLKLAFRRALTSNKPALIKLLRNKLLKADRRTSLPAIELIDRLNITQETELELLAVAAENNPRITSAVMTLLASLRSAASLESLYAGLQHHDTRVRANALESLRKRNQNLPDNHNHDWQPTVKRNTLSDDNRLRANAIRALADLDHEDSDHQLSKMLRDTRPMHRISALWLAEQYGSLNCAVEVATLAKNDNLKPVRKRARRSAARLLGKLNTRKIPPYNPNAKHPTITITTTKNSRYGNPKQQIKKLTPQLTPIIILAFSITQFATRCLAQSAASPQQTTDSPENEIAQSFTHSFTAHQTNPLGWTVLWWVSAIIAFALTLAYIIRLRQNNRKRFAPTIRTITRNLGLSPLQTLLLNHLARKTGLPNALPILISHGSFNHHTTSYLNSKSIITKTLKKPLQSILNKSKNRLFSTTHHPRTPHPSFPRRESGPAPNQTNQ